MAGEIEGVCTVTNVNGEEIKVPVSRDKQNKFHCEHLNKNGHCGIDHGKCFSRRFLPYLAAMENNGSPQSRR